MTRSWIVPRGLHEDGLLLDGSEVEGFSARELTPDGSDLDG